MTAELPKPNDNKPQRRGFRPFDELQVRYRSESWHKKGGRFDGIDFTSPVLPDLYAEPDYKAGEIYSKELEDLTQRASIQRETNS